MNAQTPVAGASSRATRVSIGAHRVVVPLVNLMLKPNTASDLENQITYGGRVDVHEVLPEDWVRVTSLRDGYEGFIPFASLVLSGNIVMPTHRVKALCAATREQPTRGSRFYSHLWHNSAVCVAKTLNGYSLINKMGWVENTDLATIVEFERDPVEVALRYARSGTRYLMGGNTADYIDCSALVQQAFFACGKVLPRNARDQHPATMHFAVDTPERGDLLFFRNDNGYICHVALYVGNGYVVHASGREGEERVFVQALSEVERTRGKVFSICRVPIR